MSKVLIFNPFDPDTTKYEGPGDWPDGEPYVEPEHGICVPGPESE